MAASDPPVSCVGDVTKLGRQKCCNPQYVSHQHVILSFLSCFLFVFLLLLIFFFFIRLLILSVIRLPFLISLILSALLKLIILFSLTSSMSSFLCLPFLTFLCHFPYHILPTHLILSVVFPLYRRNLLLIFVSTSSFLFFMLFFLIHVPSFHLFLVLYISLFVSVIFHHYEVGRSIAHLTALG